MNKFKLLRYLNYKHIYLYFAMSVVMINHNYMYEACKKLNSVFKLYQDLLCFRHIIAKFNNIFKLLIHTTYFGKLKYTY